MRAEIKGYSCSDRQDYETWRSASTEEVYLGLELSIGQVGKEGADLFQIVIAIPQAISERPERRKRQLLVVHEYNWLDVKETLEKWVAECDRLAWEQVLDCLRKHFDWEYEGMSPE